MREENIGGRENTPKSYDSSLMTPKKRKASCDRYITTPGGSKIVSKFNYLANETTPTKNRTTPSSEAESNKRDESRNQIYQEVLVNEILPTASPGYNSDKYRRSGILTFTNPPRQVAHSPVGRESPLDYFSGSQLSSFSQKLLQTRKKLIRYISKTPYKVLDAPELQDDFYLNLVDWSSGNFLGVGLGTCVYLWSANTSRVIKLCDLGPYDSITSVNWMQRGSHLAVGTNTGLVQLWDIQKLKKVRQFKTHKARVGSMSWNDHILSSGSRDRIIVNHDVRDSCEFSSKLNEHKQEVCGLRWNSEGTQLASGGNDNKLFVWDCRSSNAVCRFTDHIAAVKAIAWSPHTHGLLASGGGTADRTIRFWNTNNSSLLNKIDTGSQVCNLAWSKNSKELVSTHGYSQNQVIVWKYPNLDQIATLTGHTYRVLYLAMSPDGQNIVTGAGDETLRFWTVFNKTRFRQNNKSENVNTIR